MAGTAAGIVATDNAWLLAPPPPNGNIFDRLDAHGITWRNYHSDLPSVAILIKYAQRNTNKLLPIARFFADVAAGTLPAVSVVDPAFNGGGSEENPDDIRVGEQFAAQVINAVMAGPPPDAVAPVSPGSHANQRSLSRRRAANARMGEPLAEVWSQVRPGAPDPAR